MVPHFVHFRANNIRMREIVAGIEAERLATEGLVWRELLLPANRYRVFIIITLQIGMPPFPV